MKARVTRRLVRMAAKKSAIEGHDRLPQHVVGRWPTEGGTQITSAGKVLPLLTRKSESSYGKDAAGPSTYTCCGMGSRLSLRATAWTATGRRR